MLNRSRSIWASALSFKRRKLERFAEPGQKIEVKRPVGWHVLHSRILTKKVVERVLERRTHGEPGQAMQVEGHGADDGVADVVRLQRGQRPDQGGILHRLILLSLATWAPPDAVNRQPAVDGLVVRKTISHLRSAATLAMRAVRCSSSIASVPVLSSGSASARRRRPLGLAARS